MNDFATYFGRFLPAAWYDTGLTERDELSSGQPNDDGMRRPARLNFAKTMSATFFVAVMATSANVRAESITSRPCLSDIGVGDYARDRDKDLVPPSYWSAVSDAIMRAPIINEENFEDSEMMF